MINAQVAVPVVAAVRLCGPGSARLTASASGTGAVYRWFSVAVGGSVLATASVFNTPTLTANRHVLRGGAAQRLPERAGGGAGHD